jgi:hypothetical protein
MSYLEDDIRGALRTEAGRLREVRPLHLPPAPAQDSRAAYRASLGHRLSAWRAPLAAAAAVVIIAAVLVIVRSAGNEHAAPVAAPTPIAGPPLPADATPRYYVRIGVNFPVRGWTILVGDVQTGRTIATHPLGKGNELSSYGIAGAGDDRTFVVSAAVTGPVSGPPGKLAPGPPLWYLVRILPGAAAPVRVTRLTVDFNFKAGGQVRDIALSADGTELAVVSGTAKSTVLGVYSVATGQLQGSWSAPLDSTPLDTPATNRPPVSDLSWVGDGTVGFAVTGTPGVREEVRTLDTSVAGTSLLAASHVVWSQYVPAPPRGSNPAHAPQACGTPFLSGNGQAVVCAASTYSARDERLSAVWLAYPLAAPTRPRVLGSVPQPQDVSHFDFNSVEWTNPSGTEIIGTWNPTVVSAAGVTTTNFIGFIGHGTVRPFAPLPGPEAGW